MAQRILPSTIDNTYKGNKAALWFYYLITAVTVVRSLIHILKDDGGAQSIATIPLDTFTKNGSATVVLIFAYWGLSQLMFGIIQVVVACRYKSFIPFIYLMLVVEWSARFLLAMSNPIETVGVAPGAVGNMILPFVCLLMFLLSMKEKID